jgi:hypothetical protein
MRKINKFVAIAILATIATVSAPQSAKAGILMSDRSSTGIIITDKTGIMLSDFTGIIITDFTQALTGIMLGD